MDNQELGAGWRVTETYAMGFRYGLKAWYPHLRAKAASTDTGGSSEEGEPDTDTDPEIEEMLGPDTSKEQEAA